MSYRNSHSVMVSDISKYLTTCCDNAYQQGRADAEQSAWHIVKWHEITEEERKEKGYNEDWVYYLDCTMPNDEEEILVVTKHNGNYYVDKDINMIDDGYYLDSGLDWRDDIVAWREMPKFDSKQLKEQKK